MTGPTVCLYAHRLQDPTATGISRYARGLPAALASLRPAPFGFTMASSREAAGPEGLPADLAHFQPPLPRRALHLAWATAHAPAVDRFVGHPDLVHVLYPSTPVPSRAPVVYTFHDLMPLRHPDWFGRTERWAFGRAVSDAAERAAAIVTQSQAVADEAHQLLGIDRSRLHAVHTAVGPEFSSPVPEAEVTDACRRYDLRPGRYLLALGTVSTRKNLLPVVEAVTGVGNDLPLVAVGPPGAGAEDVQALVHRRQATDRVRLLGWIPPGDVTRLLRGALALVHPSVEEGFGLTPLEAMACGVPSIVSRQGALPEVVGDASLTAEASDPDSWRTVIERLVGDDDLRAALIDRGRVRAAGFTWARTAARTAAVYRLVLGLPPV